MATNQHEFTNLLNMPSQTQLRQDGYRHVHANKQSYTNM